MSLYALGAASTVDVEAAHQRVLDAADKLVAEVQSQYVKGGVKLGFTPDILLDRVASVSFITGVFKPVIDAFNWLIEDTSQRDAIQHNYELLGDAIKDWAGRRSTADKGVRANGMPYTWEQWAREGQFYATEIPSRVQQAWDTSAIGFLGQAVIDTFQDYALILGAIGKGVTDAAKGNMPDWVKWSLGIGGGLVVIGTFIYVAGPILGRMRRESKKLATRGDKQLGGVRVNVGPAGWKCGLVEDIQYTRSGIQKTRINGRTYATTFDWRDWTKAQMKKPVLFKKIGPADGYYRLMQVDLKPAPRNACKGLRRRR